MRNLTKMQKENDGKRSLFESVMVPEVTAALTDWKRSTAQNGVLIGGLALSFYVKPRYTEDVDILYFQDSDIPKNVTGFRRTRPHAFEHRKTGVEIELVTPGHVGVPGSTVEKVFESANESDGLKIASPSALVALKLFRLSAQDKADIISLIKVGEIDLVGFGLSQDQITKFVALVEEAKIDPE